MRHSEILDNLQFLTKKKPTQQDLANALMVSINTIGSRAARDSEYSTEEIKTLNNYYNCDIFKAAYSDRNNTAQNNCIAQENIATIDADYYSDVFGSCGSGVFVLSEAKEKMQVPISIIEGFRKFKKYSVINAIGDSMQPFIHDKDLLVVEHYDGEQIRDNRVYVFRFGDKIFVKRLVLNINQLIIKSDNREYESITLINAELNDIQIIGQIVGLMRGMR